MEYSCGGAGSGRLDDRRSEWRSFSVAQLLYPLPHDPRLAGPCGAPGHEVESYSRSLIRWKSFRRSIWSVKRSTNAD